MREDQGHGSYVLQVLENTQRYAQGLLQHNERLATVAAAVQKSLLEMGGESPLAGAVQRDLEELRAREVAMDEERRQLRQELEALRAAVGRSVEQQQALLDQLAQIEQENRTFSAQYVEVEQQNSNLANLYVASYRLHGTLDRAEVMATIQEVVINLIGCEEFIVYRVDRRRQTLEPVSSFGVPPERLLPVELGAGLIGGTALDGECCLDPPDAIGDESHLRACIPLKLDGEVTGVIALFRLLGHKAKLEAVDRELFDLLVTHAAPALYCSQLHADVVARQGNQGAP